MATNLDQLPERLRRLDEVAFKEFMLAFGSRLYRFFRSLSLQPADAESLATSCLTDVGLKIDQFSSRGPGSFERWVLKLARVAFINEWRKRDQASSLADPSHYWYESAWLGMPDDAVNAAVEKGMAALSETDRDIVRWRHYEQELSFAEIGQRLKMSEEAVRVRHHRALKKLEAFLSEHPAVVAWQKRNSRQAVAQEMANDER
jgi:RNA polymerase sigma factor (sigma-70 family)